MRSVILSAGRSCFVACPGCYNHFAKTVADTRAVLRFMRQLRHQFGLAKVTVGGGDPLTRPDILDLLAGLRQIGLRIHLDTVGTAFLRDAEIRFMGQGVAANVPAGAVAEHADLIGIPLDGSSDAVMRRFRRRASLADQLAILDLLDGVGAAVCVNTVVHAGNAHDITRIAEIAATHRCVKEWQLFQFMPIGPLGYRNRHHFLISNHAFRDATAAVCSDSPAGVKVVAKPADRRKNRYLLIDSAGVLWIPEQSAAPSWSIEDENARRHVVGRLDDDDVHQRIAALNQADEE